jgi:broad specificity phosphatase PhoE
MTENHKESLKSKEKDMNRREVEVHFFRHGEQIDHAPDSGITEEALQSAFQAGRKLINQIGQGELVKFITSQRTRAKETLNKIQEGLVTAIEESDRDDIKIYSEGSRTRPDIRMFDIERGTKWFREFASSEDSMGYWLDNPSEETESPQSVLATFQRFVKRVVKVADRLPEGPKIHYVVVTHSGPMRAFLRSEFDQGTGDDLGYCEAFNLDVPLEKNKQPTVRFRDHEKQIDV